MPAVNPSTDRPTSWVADDETPAISSTSRRRTPVHLALPDEIAADLVADAGDRHVLLEHRQREQLVPGQRRLALDQPVDAQAPGRDIDARNEQGRIDPVEPVVRHDDRGQARRRRGEVGPGGQRRDELRSRREGTGRDRGGSRPVEQGTATDAGEECRDTDGAGPQQERAAGRVRHRGRGRGARGRGRGGSRPGARTASARPARPTRPPAARRRPGWRAGRRAPPGSPGRRTRRSPARRPRTRRTARIPSPAPNASAASTTTISRASLSLVPNSATTKSLAPGGWRSMTDLADGGDERGGARAAARRRPRRRRGRGRRPRPRPRPRAARSRRDGQGWSAAASRRRCSRPHGAPVR